MEDGVAYITGQCKWSVSSALIDNAISMRETPERWNINKEEQLSFITLIEASKCRNLDVEVFSEEGGCCFSEHYIIRHGEVEVDETVPFYDIYTGEYNSKEEAEEDFGIEIEDDKWEEDEFIQIGGFDWNYAI